MIAFAPLLLLIQGAALAPDRVYAWGDELAEWSLPDLKKTVLAKGSFGEGGCLDDTGSGLFLSEESHLTYRRAPDWSPRVLDHGIDMHDCLATTLLGHRGVLINQRGMQLRFYEYPDFHYTEIYSFYSASRQGGLLLTDIDGDGLPDIISGNYWAHSPAAFDLPWHIFNMELYNKGRDAATLRMALDHSDLILAQGHLANGKVARFRKPSDPKQPWVEERIGEYHYPRALAAASSGILIGENNGPHSRVFLNAKPLEESDGLIAAFPYRDGFLLVGRDRVYFRRYASSPERQSSRTGANTSIATESSSASTQ